MFSGLGSIADLNSQFAQFTSNLTNLDSLQDGTGGKKAVQEHVDGKPKGSEDQSSAEDRLKELNNHLAQRDHDAALTQALLLSCQEEVSQKNSFVDVLQRQLQEEHEAKAHICAQFEELREVSQQEISTLRHQLHQLQSAASGSSATKETVISEVTTVNVCVNNDSELVALREQLQASVASLDAARSTISAMEARQSQSSTSIAELTQTCEDLSQNSTKKQEEMEREVQGYLGNIVELNEDNTVLRASLAESEAKRAACENRLQQATASATDRDAAMNSSLDEAGQLQGLLSQKEAQVSELEGKTSTLKEKLKDMMHRFAELKSKSAAQVQHLEERVVEVSQLMQAKDSEILSCRLKLENTDRSSSDLRLKATELAERFGEAQREITKLRELVEDKQVQLDALGAEKARLESETQVSLSQMAERSSQLADAEARCQSLQSSHADELRLLAEGKAKELREGTELAARLQAELAEAHSRLRVGEDSADNLDNYKKRAQLALKKANSAAAVLTAEMQQLQAALDDTTAKLQEAQEAGRIALLDQQSAIARADALEKNKFELESALREQDLAREALEQKFDAQVQDLQKRITQQENELKIGLASRRIDPETTVSVKHASAADGSFGESAGGFVSISKAAGSSVPGTCAVAEEDAASQMSLDADSTSTAHEGAHTHHHHPSSSNMRDSWAMVAASTAGSANASAALSVASSTEEAEGGGQRSASATGGTSAAAGRLSAEDSSDFRTALSSDSLLFISQLQSHLESTKKSLSQRGIELEAAHQQVQYERDEKRVLKNRVEELLAFLDRTKQLREGPDSATNMEYLKNCILKFMSSSDMSEKRRLYPVIATILKLTAQEMKTIELAFQVCEERENEFQNTISSIGSFATTSIGSLWGSVLGGGSSGSGSAGPSIGAGSGSTHTPAR